jgi:hypothetical protein
VVQVTIRDYEFHDNTSADLKITEFRWFLPLYFCTIKIPRTGLNLARFGDDSGRVEH